MKTAYIFHDAFSDPLADWYPWMKTALESFGYTTFVPNFPTPGGQSYESWRAVIKNYIPTFDEETIIIGHGSGGLFALRLVEESKKQIHGLFLVASYAEKINHAGYDRVNESMFHDFKFDAIKSHAMVIQVFAGDDDPFVPAAITEDLAKKLGVTTAFIPSGGHINKASGFNQLVIVASAIQDADGDIAKSLEMQNSSQVLSESSSLSTETGNQKSAIHNVVPLPPQDTATGANLEKAASSIPAQQPEVSQKKIDGLETMYGDMSRLVNSNRGTVASSLLKEARIQEQEIKNVSPSSPQNVFYIIGAIVVILVGLGVFAVVIKNNASVVPVASQSVTVASLISADTHVSISILGESYKLAAAMHTDLSQGGSDGSVTDIDYTNGAGLASFKDVLNALGVTTLPDSLAGVIPSSSGSNPVFMHGQAFIGRTPSPFLVIPVSDYDTAFSGMRDWEQTLFRDTAPFMNVPDSFVRGYLATAQFDNELIGNHAVRVLRYKSPVADNSGNATAVSPYQDGDMMVAYFFLNDHAIVIINNPNVIPTILERYDDRQVYGKK